MHKIISILFVTHIIFMQFTFFYVSNFAVQISAITYIILFIIMAKNIELKNQHLMVLIFLGVIPLIPLIYSSINYEFIKSYVLYSILIVSLFICLSHKKIIITNNHNFNFGLIFIINFLSLYTILQYVLMNHFNIYSLVNPFGSFSTIGPGGFIYEPHYLAEIKRPNLFYSEPSILGWTLTLLFGIHLYISKFKLIDLLTFLLTIVAIVCTNTLSGALNLVIVLILFFHLKSKNANPLIKLILIGTMTLGLSYYVSTHTIFQRFEDINNIGTSTYFRVTAPFLLIKDSLFDYPFGVILGDESYILSKYYMINWAGGNNSGIDNSFFVIIFRFGFFGLIIVLSLLIVLAYKIINYDKRVLFLTPTLLLLSQTGSLWSFKIIFILLFISILYKEKIK